MSRNWRALIFDFVLPVICIILFSAGPKGQADDELTPLDHYESVCLAAFSAFVKDFPSESVNGNWVRGRLVPTLKNEETLSAASLEVMEEFFRGMAVYPVKRGAEHAHLNALLGPRVRSPLFAAQRDYFGLFGVFGPYSSDRFKQKLLSDPEIFVFVHADLENYEILDRPEYQDMPRLFIAGMGDPRVNEFQYLDSEEKRRATVIVAGDHLGKIDVNDLDLLFRARVIHFGGGHIAACLPTAMAQMPQFLTGSEPRTFVVHLGASYGDNDPLSPAPDQQPTLSDELERHHGMVQNVLKKKDTRSLSELERDRWEREKRLWKVDSPYHLVKAGRPPAGQPRFGSIFHTYRLEPNEGFHDWPPIDVLFVDP